MEDEMAPAVQSPSRNATYTAVFTQGDDGWITAEIVEVPEAMSQGRTLDEAKVNVADALELALRSRQRDGEEIPSPREVTVSPVTVRI
jgi:predicted RNase H-like HicB family nuclease